MTVLARGVLDVNIGLVKDKKLLSQRVMKMLKSGPRLDRKLQIWCGGARDIHLDRTKTQVSGSLERSALLMAPERAWADF